MKRFFFIAVAIMVTSATIAAESLTQAEKAQVAQLASQTEQSCVSGLAKQADLNQGPFSITPGYVKNYCGCIGNGMQTKIDAKMMRQGTEADGQKLLQAVAQDCAVREFKANLPKQCRQLYEELPRDPSIPSSEQDVAEFCGCVEQSVANLTGAQLTEATRQTIQEYQSYKRDPKFEPKLPLSLVNSSKNCMRKMATKK